MPRVGSRASGCWGTVRTTTGMSSPESRSFSMSCGPLTLPWSSRSTITTSGRSWLGRLDDLRTVA
jgi:hypothetical protein